MQYVAQHILAGLVLATIIVLMAVLYGLRVGDSNLVMSALMIVVAFVIAMIPCAVITYRTTA